MPPPGSPKDIVASAGFLTEEKFSYGPLELGGDGGSGRTHNSILLVDHSGEHRPHLLSEDNILC